MILVVVVGLFVPCCIESVGYKQGCINSIDVSTTINKGCQCMQHCTKYEVETKKSESVNQGFHVDTVVIGLRV